MVLWTWYCYWTMFCRREDSDILFDRNDPLVPLRNFDGIPGE